jgi:hypothetical protein
VRGVNPAPTRRFAGRKDISAVFKSEVIDADDAVDGWIDGESNDQYPILRRIGTARLSGAFHAMIIANLAPLHLLLPRLHRT